MQYLDYSEYLGIGGVLDVTAFSRNVDRAAGVIDYATRNRVSAMAEVPKTVQACCRDLTEYFAGHDNTQGATVTSRSQSAGAVSQSESYNVTDASAQADDVEQLLLDYLLGLTDDNGTPLLYRGAFE